MTHGDLGLADNRGSSQVVPTVHGRIIPIEVVEQYQPYLSVGIIIPNIWKNKKSNRQPFMLFIDGTTVDGLPDRPSY